MTEHTGEGLTFEKVWAMFQETDRRLKERIEETDKRLKESMEQTDRRLEETNQAVKEASRIVGDLGNKFGKLSEYLVVPNMLDKFNALGYVFTKASRNIKFLDSNKKTLTEVDVLLENGDSAIVVEVKSDLTIDYVNQHIERMEKLRRYWDDHNDKRELIGAVAGAIMEDRVKKHALNTGFYAIVQSGDTVKIEPPEGFTPRVW
jgi:hypothetical protein